MRIAILTLALGALAAAAPAQELHWRDERHPLRPAPAGLPAPAAEALDLWVPWANRYEYRMYLDDDARVLFIARKPNVRTLKLIDSTTAFFDASLPAPEREQPAGSTAARTTGPGGIPRGSAGTPDVIPEDPETGETGTSLDEALFGAPRWESAWGAGSGPLDRDTIVLLAVDQDEYDSVIDRLVEVDPSLAGWAASARSSLGFVLESPPVGAWVLGADGQEEWDPDGELVHRLTDLLLMRRFGRQPYWIVRGIAWHAEMKLRRLIYCYPFRDEFVYAVEHGGWPTDVRNRVKREFKEELLSIGDLAGLERGGWDGEAARMAYATMAWMMEQRSEGLVKVLEDLREAYGQGSRVDKGGGLWERNAGYEVPPDVVNQLFHVHLGDGVYAELTEALKTFR